MAESAVSFAIEKLSSFLVAEAELQRGLKGEMESLQNELASINTVLKDADRKAEQRSDVDIKEWLRQVRKMAYQIEDVVDEYLALKQEPRSANRHELATAENECKDCVLKMGNVLVKAIKGIVEIKPRHQMANTIKDIKEELAEIQRRKESYKLVSTTSMEEQKQGCQDYHGYYSTYLEDSELLGIDKPKSDIIRMLNMKHQNWRRFMIAMVGMGGVGKATLMQKVYDDKELRKHFCLSAWISVSQSYNRKDILRSMFKQLLKAGGRHDAAAKEVDSLTDAQIIQNLRNFLQEQQNQRYLIVLDDIWDTELLPCVRDALPTNLDGRILMTTRQRDVAQAWTTSLSGHVHELHPLPPNEAWDLFCIKTFRNRDCPQELEDLSRQIVEKCEGLPLAIVAIGGYLSTKQQSYSSWRKLLNSLGSELTSNRELTSVKRILLLSYHELPHYLKPCFLYIGMFPEDYSIAHMRLIRIWIAEGFVERQRGKTLEEVGEEYLTELIQRNLIQVARAEATGKYIRVRVHDILRVIIISELEETGFGQPMLNDNLPTKSQFRRLSINNSGFVNNNMLDMIGNESKIRCLILINDDTRQEVPKVRTVIRSVVKVAPLLKVVDLQDTPIHDIPKEVGNLRLLRFLSLRKTKVKTLPKWIGGLVNLETLDLRATLIRELPKEISHLCKLRHLRAYDFDYKGTVAQAIGVKIPTGVLQNLKELQKLTYIEIGGETTTTEAASKIIKELRNLQQLRKLGISFRTENGFELCSVMQEMKYLESLFVESANKDELMGLQDGRTTPPLSLQRLYIHKGIMHKLPDWMAQLVNLVSLGFKYSKLHEDPLPILERLPNLVHLCLAEDAYQGDQLDFGNSGFQKLQVLQLKGLVALKRIIGVTPPFLQGYILECPILQEVTPQLLHLVHPRKKIN